jgi:hypothetical protein
MQKRRFFFYTREGRAGRAGSSCSPFRAFRGEAALAGVWGLWLYVLMNLIPVDTLFCIFYSFVLTCRLIFLVKTSHKHFRRHIFPVYKKHSMSRSIYTEFKQGAISCFRCIFYQIVIYIIVSIFGFFLYVFPDAAVFFGCKGNGNAQIIPTAVKTGKKINM